MRTAGRLRGLRQIVIALAMLAAGGGGARAAGIIIPEPPPHLIRPNAPIDISIKSHRVKVGIRDRMAVTEVEQVFVSHYPEVIEGTYVFPLPKGAAISQLFMYIDGEKVQGELLDARQARKIYEDIVRQMRDPALLEYADRDLYKLSIYPINPNEEKQIIIRYSQTLKSDFGLTQYRYPLDAKRFSIKPIEQVTVAVDLQSRVPVRNVFSPTHGIDVVRGDAGIKVGYEAAGATPDKDFILYFTVDESNLGAGLLTYPDHDGDGGYFLLMLAPDPEVDADTRMPKDVVIVMDTSGSMAGTKIIQAREAIKFIVNSLDREDRFGIIEFATDVTVFGNGLMPASGDNTARALQFADRLQARGATNIFEAARQAFEMVRDSDRPAYVLFITDGKPTVGLTSKDDILRGLHGLDRGEHIRLFAFGVGYDVNFHLLDQMAEDHGGQSDYVAPDEDMELKISNFYRKIKDPVLSDVQIRLSGVETFDMHPNQVRDIFAGGQITMVGRYRGQGRAAITVKGDSGHKTVTHNYNVKFPSSPEEETIPILWANRRIGFLLNEVRLGGENDEVVDEIVRLSKKFGIVTPYTSYLVLEPDWDRGVAVSPGQPAPRPRFEDMRDQSGAAAFSAARTARALEESVSADGLFADRDESERDRIRVAGSRTFVLRDEVWVQSDYADEKLLEVKFLSDEYFELSRLNPEVSQYMGLGSSVIFKLDRKWIKIVP